MPSSEHGTRSANFDTAASAKLRLHSPKTGGGEGAVSACARPVVRGARSLADGPPAINEDGMPHVRLVRSVVQRARLAESGVPCNAEGPQAPSWASRTAASWD